MVARRVIAGIALTTAVAVGCAVVPAIAADEGRALAPRRIANIAPGNGIGSFTPAAGDPRLAAALARAGVSASGFRFTPSGADKAGTRAVTVAVRARSSRAVAADRLSANSPVALAPIAYNLGVAVGWKRFALSGDLAKVDLAGQPGSRESVDFGMSYTGRSISGRVKAEATRPIGNAPRLVEDNPSYSVDVGGSYSLTRNLDVTAGVRYKTERENLPRIVEDRRDSQSVYVGTAFRF